MREIILLHGGNTIAPNDITLLRCYVLVSNVESAHETHITSVSMLSSLFSWVPGYILANLLYSSALKIFSHIRLIIFYYAYASDLVILFVSCSDPPHLPMNFLQFFSGSPIKWFVSPACFRV